MSDMNQTFLCCGYFISAPHHSESTLYVLFDHVMSAHVFSCAQNNHSREAELPVYINLEYKTVQEREKLTTELDTLLFIFYLNR